MQKPDAPSCERNREPILAVLRDHFADRHAVLEIGSGTGQHAVFSANTLHIMSWSEVERLFAGLPGILTDDARLVIYGPFNYGGQYTSESNAVFNAWLKSQGAHQGLRDFEAVDALARQAGLVLLEDRAMPSNYRCLVWRTAPLAR